MKKSTITILFVLVSAALIYYGYCRGLKEFVDVLILSVAFGIVFGLASSYLFKQTEDRTKINSVTRKLLPYMGSYNVFLIGQTKEDLYKIEMSLDDPLNSIVRIDQSGTEEPHKLVAYVKFDETFSFGQGHYVHPEKSGKPIGEIRIFIVDPKTINVDKLYLDDTGQKMNYEKWQWRR